ncbi:MAG: lytic transglycosylase domain-containing protein [Bdellovibrionales bacterium]|nr:lytic transglycosylase domain-containing protein [Bdellovibrionales bacterium]
MALITMNGMPSLSSNRNSHTSKAGTLVFLLCLLFSGCATKHQPLEYSDYFPSKPGGYFEPNQIQEARHLAAKEDLNPYDKSRLVHLYLNEMKSLESGTSRYQELLEKVSALQEELRPLREQWVRLQLEQFRKIAESRKLHISRAEKEPKGPYEEARVLWNADRNREALAKLSLWMQSRQFNRYTPSDLRVKAYYMRFRIALDVGNYALASESYEQIARLSPCSWRGTQASFVSAVLSFAYGNPKRALDILKKKCDPDNSYERKLQDAYWEARFLEKLDPESSRRLFETIAASQVPTYYNFLAQNQLGQPYWVDVSSQRSYLWNEFKLPEVSHEELLNAEKLLNHDLRQEASLYLRNVASELLQKNVRTQAKPLLYTANLLKASGQHLDALQIYYTLSSSAREEAFPAEKWFQLNFIQDMFPRPFANRVEWLSKMWRVDPDYVYSIMRQESAFTSTAVSGAKAQGLMQMMPFLSGGISQQWGYEDYFAQEFMFTGEENLKLAIFHLFQLQSYAPHPALMAGAYNAGLERVRNWWQRFSKYPLDVFIEMVPVKETRQYMMLVLRNYIYYKILHTGQPVPGELFAFQLPAIRRN